MSTLLWNYRSPYRPTFQADWKRVISPRRWWILGAFIGSVVGAGALASMLAGTGAAAHWYAALRKPAWIPPQWLLAAMWLSVSALAGCSAWRIWLAPHSVERRQSLRLYGLQFLLSALWLPLFFVAHSPVVAFIDVALLLSTLLWMQPRFRRVDWSAARLLTPYLLSVSFGLLLNLSIVNMN